MVQKALLCLMHSDQMGDIDVTATADWLPGLSERISLCEFFQSADIIIFLFDLNLIIYYLSLLLLLFLQLLSTI